jgi:hypothetical protein
MINQRCTKRWVIFYVSAITLFSLECELATVASSQQPVCCGHLQHSQQPKARTTSNKIREWKESN